MSFWGLRVVKGRWLLSWGEGCGEGGGVVGVSKISKTKNSTKFSLQNFKEYQNEKNIFSLNFKKMSGGVAEGNGWSKISKSYFFLQNVFEIFLKGV